MNVVQKAPALQGAVQRAGRAGLALHLDRPRAPRPTCSTGPPPTTHRPARPWGRRRDRVDRDHLAQPVGDAGCGLVAVDCDLTHRVPHAMGWRIRVLSRPGAVCRVGRIIIQPTRSPRRQCRLLARRRCDKSRSQALEAALAQAGAWQSPREREACQMTAPGDWEFAYWESTSGGGSSGHELPFRPGPTTMGAPPALSSYSTLGGCASILRAGQACISRSTASLAAVLVP